MSIVMTMKTEVEAQFTDRAPLSLRGRIILGALCLLVGLGLAFITAPELARADELTYKPVNPAFGGNPFNGPYLLSNAQEQRQFEAPERKSKPAVEQFGEEVQRALLFDVSRQISEAILGEDAKESGSFSVGTTTLDFRRVNDQVEIKLMDSTSGGQTTMTIPVPTY